MPEIVKYKTFVTYLVARLRSTSIWSLADRVIKYTRRFLLVGRILKYISIAFAIIETSAVLLLAAAALAVIIPVAFIALTAIYIADLVIGARILRSRQLREYLSRERICVISQAGEFGEGFARELSDGGGAVFVITAAPSRKFISARYEDGVYYVRHAFFFRLKRRILTKRADRLTYLL